MKRVIAGILILVFVFSFSACGEKEKVKNFPKEQPKTRQTIRKEIKINLSKTITKQE